MGGENQGGSSSSEDADIRRADSAAGIAPSVTRRNFEDRDSGKTARNAYLESRPTAKSPTFSTIIDERLENTPYMRDGTAYVRRDGTPGSVGQVDGWGGSELKAALRGVPSGQDMQRAQRVEDKYGGPWDPSVNDSMLDGVDYDLENRTVQGMGPNQYMDESGRGQLVWDEKATIPGLPSIQFDATGRPLQDLNPEYDPRRESFVGRKLTDVTRGIQDAGLMSLIPGGSILNLLGIGRGGEDTVIGAPDGPSKVRGTGPDTSGTPTRRPTNTSIDFTQVGDSYNPYANADPTVDVASLDPNAGYREFLARQKEIGGGEFGGTDSVEVASANPYTNPNIDLTRMSEQGPNFTPPPQVVRNITPNVSGSAGTLQYFRDGDPFKPLRGDNPYAPGGQIDQVTDMRSGSDFTPNFYDLNASPEVTSGFLGTDEFDDIQRIMEENKQRRSRIDELKRQSDIMRDQRFKIDPRFNVLTEGTSEDERERARWDGPPTLDGKTLPFSDQDTSTLYADSILSKLPPRGNFIGINQSGGPVSSGSALDYIPMQDAEFQAFRGGLEGFNPNNVIGGSFTTTSPLLGQQQFPFANMSGIDEKIFEEARKNRIDPLNIGEPLGESTFSPRGEQYLLNEKRFANARLDPRSDVPTETAPFKPVPTMRPPFNEVYDPSGAGGPIYYGDDGGQEPFECPEGYVLTYTEDGERYCRLIEEDVIEEETPPPVVAPTPVVRPVSTSSYVPQAVPASQPWTLRPREGGVGSLADVLNLESYPSLF